MASLKTYNASGGLQINSEAIMYAFVGKRTIMGSTFYNTDTGQYQGFWGALDGSLPEHQLCAVRSTNCTVLPGASSPSEYVYSNDGYQVPSANGLARSQFGSLIADSERGVTVDMYLFKQYRYTADSGSPFKLYNGAWEKTFDGGYPPLRIVGAVPITSLNFGQSVYYSTNVPGRTLAYFIYGTVVNGGAAPNSAGADVPTSSVFNASRPGVRDAANGQGFYIEDIRGAGICDGPVFAGGMLCADVTGY